MKKILIFLLLLLPFIGISQAYQWIGTTSNTVLARGGLKGDSAIYMPVYNNASDTAFFTHYDALGKMFFAKDVSKIYVRDTISGTRIWNPITSGIILADNGLSNSGDTIELGQAEDELTNPAILLNNRKIPQNGHRIWFQSNSDTTNNFIIGDTTESGLDWRRIGKVQINSSDTIHPLLTIGPSPSSNIASTFSDGKAQLVIGLVDTPRHNLSQQNLKAGGLIVSHKSYFPVRTRHRLGATQYTIQGTKEYRATDTVDFQSGNPGGDIIGSVQGEHIYGQMPGYSGRTIYISDSSFGSEPHIFNANTNITSTIHTINNGSGSKTYLEGWYGMYNGQVLMGTADTIENLVGYSSGAWSGGSGFYIKRYYNIAIPWQGSSAYGIYHGIWDAWHPLVPAPNRYNWLGTS